MRTMRTSLPQSMEQIGRRDPFRFEVGFFQGCTASTILFDVVFMLLLDLLAKRQAGGYMIKSSEDIVKDLAYADDLTIVTKSRTRIRLHWTLLTNG